ncbi:SDR family NAD(P)-dependent oxidoreductase [Streptosporangium roseum]|uniref:Short-chain dehydrogenase/reductase SDR n=1 Tax=Streptosporangium roseum (strain ATCC 12428 / DSM 43021 / JCM 3005 / KCTC 9067 / NCIMB 10171 / NRRL 2505 / NI 9100) TaxID=479432 RepID=D2B4F1_STRRD|nr:SDR family NAD(P)-dependent oxidoreductase [Streptosporangium roseum]ACZ83637.1 short-chain dehydrogenase/reductase SDR [Streptosporangium roseum DSM 43021]
MSKIIVIAGATNGIGRGIALDRLRRGDVVVAVGSSAERGARLRADAEQAGAGDRLDFLRADLSSIAENDRVIDHVTARHPAIDALVLTANRQSAERRETAEGLEFTFALYYLSRYLLGYGLRGALEASPSPVILNVAGAGITAGAVMWDDLQLERRYGMLRAQLQGGRANDLLGVSFTEETGGTVRYVMYHPGFTDNGDFSHLPRPLSALVKLLARFAARSIDQVVPPLSGLLDTPPLQPLTAVDRGRTVPLTLRTFDPADARRLARLTEELLASRRTPR